MTKRHLNDLKKLLQSKFIKYWGLELQKSDKLRTYRESNQYSCLKNILNMFQIPLIVAIWLVLEQVVINYALIMVDRLSQRLLLQKDRGPTGVFSFAPELVGYSAPRDLNRRAAYGQICESLFLIHHELFVCS